MHFFAVLLLFCVWRMIRPHRGKGRHSRVIDLSAALALFLWCWPAAAWLFASTLEASFPVARFPARDADAIVALSANSYLTNPSQPEPEPAFSTYLRSAHAAWLFEHWRRVPIVVSGGALGDAGEPAMASLMRQQLLAGDVPDSMIWTENGSRTTYENALYTATILGKRGIRRIALVTEGIHLRRAELCFRKQGFDVVPAGCAYKTLELRSVKDFLIPSSWAIRTNEEALHEWIGLAWYKLRGRI